MDPRLPTPHPPVIHRAPTPAHMRLQKRDQFLAPFRVDAEMQQGVSYLANVFENQMAAEQKQTAPGMSCVFNLYILLRCVGLVFLAFRTSQRLCSAGRAWSETCAKTCGLCWEFGGPGWKTRANNMPHETIFSGTGLTVFPECSTRGYRARATAVRKTRGDNAVRNLKTIRAPISQQRRLRS
jgi:hypothetical protein